MTFLPIIARELRGRARNRAAHWTRFAVAAAGVLVCLSQLMWSSPFGTPAPLGPGLLHALVSVALLVSCGACLLTADVISSERREGTLGLLLLTRVRAFDVLMGKLGSAGLTSLCVLVAFLPMLLLPVLAGGVTGGEAFRKGLVLLDMLFLALAAGLWASAGGFQWFKTGRAALIVLATLTLVPGLVGSLFRGSGGLAARIGLLSPLGTLSAAGDVPYRASKTDYWISLLLVQSAGWVLLVGAGSRLQKAWREEEGEATVPVPGPAVEEATKPDGPWLSCSWTPPVPAPAAAGETETAPLLSRPLDADVNPIAWLLQRQRGTQAILWAGALISLAHYVLFLFSGLIIYFYWPAFYLAETAIEGALFAWAASRFFVEARRTGELELLMTTPFGAREIVAAQWTVLKRRLRWPMLVMLVPAFLQAGFVLLAIQGRFGPGYSFRLASAISSLISCVGIFFGVGALCWVGLWLGLKTGRQARAIVWTVSLVKGLPYLIAILCSILMSMLPRLTVGPGSWPVWIMHLLPQVITLLLYLGLIRLARQRLVGELAGAEVMSFDLRQAIASSARDAVSAFRKARHWTPS